jgi:peptidoglycan/xylan/chitin deacetylase (PgdA/CDA1 family)
MGGATNVLRVIAYHRIAEPRDSPELDPRLISATPDAFRAQVEHLARRYSPVGLSEITDAWDRGRTLPRRAVHVTVDDAYRDFRDIAWPILRENEIPVTLFVPTAYADGGRTFWWDRFHRGASLVSQDALQEALRIAAEERNISSPRRNGASDVRAMLRHLPHDILEGLVDAACLSVGVAAATAQSDVARAVLGWDELRELQAEGVALAAHTRNHVGLSVVDAERARAEIRRSLDDLDRELGEQRRAIAYPYGMCSPTVARIAREEGCVLGFTNEDGLNVPGRTDPLRLRRTNITRRTRPGAFKLRMMPWWAGVDRWRHRHQRELLL